MKGCFNGNITYFSLRYIIIINLMLSVLIQPVYVSFKQILEDKYELLDDFEKNISTDKEVQNDSEQEENIYLHIKFFEIEDDNSFIKTYFIILNHFIDFNPIIYLPPPKK